MDSNQIMIDPSEPTIPLSQIFEQETPDLTTISSKKRKRLEKYIENKLKKERRIKMLKSLSESSMSSGLLLTTKRCNNRMSKKQLSELSLMQQTAGIPLSYTDNYANNGSITESDLDSNLESDLESDLDSDPLVVNGCDLEVDHFDPLEKESKTNSTNSLEDLNYFDAKEDKDFPDEKPKLLTTKPAFIIPKRLAQIQEQREKLPVFSKEQEIVDLINGNPVVVICGETGSGKTTQVPQFLYEYGYANKQGTLPGMIGITQPRRVATISMAKRVAQELNLPETQVSYQVRYDSAVSQETSIKFMTDGILLREIAGDFLLSKYSVVIVDEAHERTLNTDLLIGLLSRIARLRLEMFNCGEFFPTVPNSLVYPLRLVVMSATLRVSDFTDNTALFSPSPPIVNVEGKLFKVNLHFSRRTPDDYCKAAYKKVCEIHNTQPQGGILVFLTGKHEIMQLVRKLNKKYPSNSISDCEKESSKRLEQAVKTYSSGKNWLKDQNESEDSESEDESVDDYSSDDDENIPDTVDCATTQPLFVVPLYSMLSPENQLKIFQQPPEGSRLVVVATNIAETSITIPNIKYVVDCGKVKEKVYEGRNSIQRFTVNWISKASAEQRAGRAGRVSEGHCFRLYSSAVFEREFLQFSLPEIRRIPIESMILNMKAIHIDNVVNFPFPSPPDKQRLNWSERLLQSLQAIDSCGLITQSGLEMAKFPIHPRLSRILVDFLLNQGKQENSAFKLTLLVYLVATMSVDELFLQDESADDLSKENTKFSDRFNKFKSTSDIQSDLLLPIIIYIQWKEDGKKETFCTNNSIRSKGIQDVDLLIAQLSDIIQRNFSVDLSSIPAISIEQVIQNQQIINAALVDSFTDQIAYLAHPHPKRPIYLSIEEKNFSVAKEDSYLFIHPNSIFSSYNDDKSTPKLIVFSEIQKSFKGMNRMKGITNINRSFLKNKSF